MSPDEQGVFFVLVIQGGPGSGEFIYDASGNLRSSNVGQATTDPLQGLSCPQGLATWNGHGAIVNLLSTANGAFFQYLDTGTGAQGALILAVASVGGSDPVNGTAYGVGSTGINPAFGDTSNIVGSAIELNAVPYTQRFQLSLIAGNGAVRPSAAIFAPEQSQSGHLAMLMSGVSPDGTALAQFLIASQPTGFTAPVPATTALLELQGSLAAGTLAALTPGSISNSIAEAIIGTLTGGLPAGEARAQSAYRLRVAGEISTAAAGPTLRLRARLDSLGGAVLADSGLFTCQPSLAAVTFNCDLALYWRNTGVTGHLDSQGRIGEAASAVLAAGQTTLHGAGRNAVTADSTAAHSIVITAQFGTADPANIANTKTGSMERIVH